MYDPLVDLYDSEPLRAVVSLPAEETNALLASALEATTNPIVSKALVAAVFQRELPNGESVAMREALRYISTVENYATKQPTKHTDLLPSGHPLGADDRVTRDDIAGYFSSTFSKKEDSDLVYEILSTTPNSVEREFAVNRIQPQQYAIVAAVEAAEDMVPVEEQDWGPILEIYDRLEDPRIGDEFEYYLVDENDNETLVKVELDLYKPMFYGTHIFPDDPETNIENPFFEDQ